jgi:hypothetical protein
MDGDSPFQRMLTSLRQTLSTRVGALSDTAETRLNRTLQHFIKEVARVQGTMDEQAILRETFDSMASWYRRNTTQINPATRSPSPTRNYEIERAVSPEVAEMLAVGGGLEMDEDPMERFERLKAMRSTAATLAPPPIPVSMQLPPALMSMDTKIKTPQQKDAITRQENVVKYRETEYNVVLNSKDRDWIRGAFENRYRFSIQLSNGTVEQGEGLQATLQNRFRNIVRIEFIKAILPVEGLDVVIPRDCPTESPDPESAFCSVLGLPFVQVMMDELTGNNMGTNQTVDKALAICQYDSTWRSDHVSTTTTTSRGYTLFFPKLMKAQRIYAPTPLGSLQKLTFQLLNPENLPLSTIPDASLIKRILYSHDISGSCYSDISGATTAATAPYLFIETKEWFPLWSYLKLDRVQFRGLTFAGTSSVNQTAGEVMNRWLERDRGHVVIGFAHTLDASGVPVVVADNANESGYANWIIIRNNFDAPVSGTASRYLFAGSAVAEEAFADNLITYTGQSGGLINLSRQVQLFLRIVCRDMDSATNIRPDNV